MIVCFEWMFHRIPSPALTLYANHCQTCRTFFHRNPRHILFWWFFRRSAIRLGFFSVLEFANSKNLMKDNNKHQIALSAKDERQTVFDSQNESETDKKSKRKKKFFICWRKLQCIFRPSWFYFATFLTFLCDSQFPQQQRQLATIWTWTTTNKFTFRCFVSNDFCFLFCDSLNWMILFDAILISEWMRILIFRWNPIFSYWKSIRWRNETNAIRKDSIAGQIETMETCNRISKFKNSINCTILPFFWTR